MRTGLLLSSTFALLLMGCASTREVAQHRGPACEDAVASVTSRDEPSARARAEPVLAHDVDEIRGYMLSRGFRGVHLAGAKRWSCSPYSLVPGPSGLVSCTAKVRVCARS